MRLTIPILLLSALGALGVPATPSSIVYTVILDTTSLNGTDGNLDFTFAGGIPAPPAGTATISSFLDDGTLGISTVTGKASGFLTSQVKLGNDPGYNDFFFQPIIFGKKLSFDLTFDGLALTASDGLSGSSAFGFSLLNGVGTTALLTPNPGGFAFIANLDNHGISSVSVLSPQATVFTGGVSPVPEPGSLELLGMALACAWVVPAFSLHRPRQLDGRTELPKES